MSDGLPAALERRAAHFERYFRARFARRGPIPARLHRALRYSALSPGKRVRPLLALCACEAVGGRWTRALPAAAALECVHTFSLVHDDLPAMDDDDFRRGRPTVHRRFDEATAILAGDGLLAMAFETLAEPGGAPSAAAGLAAVRTLAHAAGPEALVGGQVLDLEAEGRRPTAARVRRIHRMKTAALIGASLVLGGIAGGAGAAQRRRLARVGEDAGLAFQIQDDLLNEISTLKRLGKRGGTDRARGKATFPSAVGPERARREAGLRLARARRGAAAFGPRARPLVQLLDFLARRER